MAIDATDAVARPVAQARQSSVPRSKTAIANVPITRTQTEDRLPETAGYRADERERHRQDGRVPCTQTNGSDHRADREHLSSAVRDREAAHQEDGPLCHPDREGRQRPKEAGRSRRSPAALFYLAARRNRFVGVDQHRPPLLIGRGKQHALRLDAAQDRRFEVGDHDDLLADQVFR